MDLDRVYQSWRDSVDTDKVRFIHYAASLELGLTVEQTLEFADKYFNSTYNAIDFLLSKGDIDEIRRLETE